jgi:two-component system OmpR family sensor kinase
MRLSSAHRSSLYRFLALYFFAVVLTVGSFSYLYYAIKSEQYRDETYHKLRERAFELSSRIVDAQMRNRPFAFPRSEDVAFFDENGTLIAGAPMKLEGKKEFEAKEEAYYLDRSARGHLGVAYILVKEPDYAKRLDELQKEALFLFVGALLLLFLVGLYLGKLFLEPIKSTLLQLDRFVKDSAHELNTPVTTLLLATQKIERQGPKKHYLRSLKASAMKIEKIYKDLSFLAFEKEERKEPVSLRETILESLDFYEVLTEQKGLDLIVSLKECRVVADRDAINLLVGNIVDNAIKYAPPKSTIRIKLQDCRLEVENSGNIRNTKEIFERYNRADRVQGGFGIGLDIVVSVAKRYGYKVKAESKEGKVRFVVEFKEA